MSQTRVHTTNPTHIRKLPSSEVEITILSTNGEKKFNAKLPDLSEYVDSADARVWLWADSGQTSVSFDFGTVGSLTPPVDRALTGLDPEKPIVFRLAVWDPDTRKILASNNKIKVQEDEVAANQSSLLKIKKAPLGPEVWRLMLAEDQEPVLLLNDSVPDLPMNLIHRPELLTSIVPEALRQGLVHVAYSNEFEESDEDAWQQKWKIFLESHLGRHWSEIPDPEEDGIGYHNVLHWADDVIQEFSRLHDFASKLEASLGGNDDE